MKTIWKFPLELIDSQVVQLPIGAQVLTVQAQNGTPCLWAIVDPEAPKEGRTVDIYGTGHEAPDGVGDYIGTFQLMGGALVFHAFCHAIGKKP